MTVSKVEVVVLGLLADEPMHGYDLLERFRTRSMGFWVEVGKASVYQVLKRLEREGSIAGKTQEGTDGPDRRVYRLTRQGRQRLSTGLAERWSALAPYETDAGVALGFAHQRRGIVSALLFHTISSLCSLASPDGQGYQPRGWYLNLKRRTTSGGGAPSPTTVGSCCEGAVPANTARRRAGAARGSALPA